MWNEHITPVVSTATAPVPTPDVSMTMRRYAQTVAFISYIALAAAGVFLVAGIVQGFGEGAGTPEFCRRFPSSPSYAAPLPTQFTLNTDLQ